MGSHADLDAADQHLRAGLRHHTSDPCRGAGSTVLVWPEQAGTSGFAIMADRLVAGAMAHAILGGLPQAADSHPGAGGIWLLGAYAGARQCGVESIGAAGR